MFPSNLEGISIVFQGSELLLRSLDIILIFDLLYTKLPPTQKKLDFSLF